MYSKGDRRQETGDNRHETGRETGDRRWETGDGRQEMEAGPGDRRQETEGGRRETGDGRGLSMMYSVAEPGHFVFSKVEPDLNTGTGFGSTLEKTKLILNDILVVHSIID